MLDVENVLRSSGMTLEEPLSIKEDRAVLRVQRADTGSFILRLYQKEVSAYRELERSWCDGFPQVYRTYEEEGLFVVEEEDVEGISLQEHLMQAGKLAEKEAVELMLQLCSSLKTLHSLGYIHRDVKPEHILLTADQKAVLIDLDASMGIQPKKKNDTMLIGTALYAAPEQFGLTRSDVRSDIYALGILLNEMLTGNHPTVVQYRNGHLGKIIETCTRINPDDRYQSMSELMAVLDHAAKSLQLAIPSSLKNKKVLTAAACVIVLLMAVTGWIWQSDVRSLPGSGDVANSRDAFYGYTLDEDGSYLQMVNIGHTWRWDGCPQFYARHDREGQSDFYILWPARDDENEAPELQLFQVEGGKNQYVRDIPGGNSGISVKYQRKQKIGEQKYHVWKLSVGDDFGMAKTGITLSSVEDYQYILWVLGENYRPADTSTSYDGIYAVSHVPEEGWDNLEDMMESGSLMQGSYGDDIWSGINLNLSEEPDSERNTFYILQKKGTEAEVTLTRLHGFILGEGSAMSGADCMFEESLSAEDMLEMGQPEAVRIGNEEYEAIPVNLKKHIGHNDLYLTVENEKETAESMRVRITFGMDVYIEGDIEGVEAAGPGYNAEQRIFGFDKLTPDFEFTKQEDGMYRAYFSNACGRFSDWGQGMVTSLYLQLKPGYTAEEIHDGSSPYTYHMENCVYYEVFDENGFLVDNQEKLQADGWNATVTSSQDGVEKMAAATGKVIAENGMPDLNGAESVSSFRRFLEKTGYTAEEMGRFTDCVVYFDAEKMAEQRRIVFRIEVQEADQNLFAPTGPAMEGEWLQLYKYEWMEDYAHVHRDGGQGARYYIEDGTLVDGTYDVYCDPQVGVVKKWMPETGGWDIVSQECDAGATGYIYAEKGGKKYAIDVLVLGEGMSAYTSPPTRTDFTKGYLQSRRINGQEDTYGIDFAYQRGKPVTLYLAAAMGMEVMEVACTSPMVTIEPVEPYGLWHGPVYKLTFENPDGGDTWFEVTSNMNPLTFYMKEELPPGQ